MVVTEGQTEQKNIFADRLIEQLTEPVSGYTGSAGVEETLYAHTDLLGSLTFLTTPDTEGCLAFDYGAWGDINPAQGLNDFDFVVTASYTGHDYDFVLGVWFAQARVYDAGVHRFVSVDRVPGDGTVPLTLNRYVYCLDNPTGFVDPDGMLTVSIGGKPVIGATIKDGKLVAPVSSLEDIYGIKHTTVTVNAGDILAIWTYSLTVYTNGTKTLRSLSLKIGNSSAYNGTYGNGAYFKVGGISYLGISYFDKIMCHFYRGNRTISGDPKNAQQFVGMTYYVKITYYCKGTKCSGRWADYPTASGRQPEEGRTVAHNYWAFGTKVSINGRTYTVDDRGDSNMASGLWIDIYVKDHNKENSMPYSGQYLTVKIVG